MANYWILIYTDSLEQIFYILDECLLSGVLVSVLARFPAQESRILDTTCQNSSSGMVRY